LLLLNKYLKTYLLIAITSLFTTSYYAQNLIQNASFENYNTPVIWNNWGGDFVDNSSFPAQQILLNWNALNTSDVFLAACTHTYAGVPINIIGNNYTKQGNNYAGFISFTGNYETKEYIYQQLASPLQAGKIYCLSFYVSRADGITHAIKNIGAYFSISTPTLFSSYYVSATPQVLNQNGFITDTIGWTEIQGCFTAGGGEQYITIGNFNSNANTDTLFVGCVYQTPATFKYAYYYIDDISLIDQTTVGIFEEIINVRINLFPNPNSGSMQLDYDLGNNSAATMKLYDVTGKLVTTYNLLNTKGSLQMNEQSMYNGIYFYHILAGEKLLKADKIVIIK
jgi:hypothetical protein